MPRSADSTSRAILRYCERRCTPTPTLPFFFSPPFSFLLPSSPIRRDSHRLALCALMAWGLARLFFFSFSFFFSRGTQSSSGIPGSRPFTLARVRVRIGYRCFPPPFFSPPLCPARDKISSRFYESSGRELFSSGRRCLSRRSPRSGPRVPPFFSLFPPLSNDGSAT